VLPSTYPSSCWRASWLLPGSECYEHRCMFLCGRKFSVRLGKCQVAQLLTPPVRVCLVLQHTASCLPKWLHYFAFATAVNECSWCLTSGPAFGVVSVWDLILLIGMSWYLLVLNLQFLNGTPMSNIFSCAYLPSVYVLWWRVYSGLLPAFNY
jgi:hypothetical protein